MKKPVKLNENVTRALQTLGRAPLPEGMEDRIVGKIRQRRAELHTAVPEKSSWRRWTCATALAASALVVVLVSRHQAAPAATANHPVANLPARDTPQTPTVTTQLETRVNVFRPRRSPGVIRASASQASASARALTPPPLPLTQQEHLLLAFAHAPQPGSALASVTASETVVNHGLGKNALLELDHEELKPLKTTLQLTQLSTLPTPNLSGENE